MTCKVSVFAHDKFNFADDAGFGNYLGYWSCEKGIGAQLFPHHRAGGILSGSRTRTSELFEKNGNMASTFWYYLRRILSRLFLKGAMNTHADTSTYPLAWRSETAAALSDSYHLSMGKYAVGLRRTSKDTGCCRILATLDLYYLLQDDDGRHTGTRWGCGTVGHVPARS